MPIVIILIFKVIEHKISYAFGVKLTKDLYVVIHNEKLRKSLSKLSDNITLILYYNFTF